MLLQVAAVVETDRVKAEARVLPPVGHHRGRLTQRRSDANTQGYLLIRVRNSRHVARLAQERRLQYQALADAVGAARAPSHYLACLPVMPQRDRHLRVDQLGRFPQPGMFAIPAPAIAIVNLLSGQLPLRPVPLVRILHLADAVPLGVGELHILAILGQVPRPVPQHVFHVRVKLPEGLQV